MGEEVTVLAPPPEILQGQASVLGGERKRRQGWDVGEAE